MKTHFFDSSFFDSSPSHYDSAMRYIDIEKDVTPMWVADMDFNTCPAVSEALSIFVKNYPFGYCKPGLSYDRAVCDWFRKRMNYSFSPEEIIKVPGVVFGISASVRALTNIGDSILICQPVYYPFMNIIKALNRNPVVSELKENNGIFEMDFEEIEFLIKSEKVKMILFCSPHNPIGRVWTREELLKLSDLCLKNNVYILSDEIHSDLIFKGYTHIPVATLSEEIAKITITCTSPSKTFNLAGLQAANLIVKDENIKKKIVSECTKTGYYSINCLAVESTIVAYKNGEAWLNSLLSYLQNNLSIATEFFASPSSPISLIPPQGTYLLWLDCRKLGMSDSELSDFFIDKAKVKLSGGSVFGQSGSGYMRMNIACPTSSLKSSLSRIKTALKTNE